MKIPQTPSSSDDAAAEQAMAWFARLRGNNVSEQQKAQCAAWLVAGPAHQQAYRELEAFWAHPDFTGLLGEAKLSAALSKPQSRYRWQNPLLFGDGGICVADGGHLPA